MTRLERKARKLILKEIMQSQNVTPYKAKLILQELEQFGLIKFSRSGEFGIKVAG
ncbi:hypothetical protein [Streptococcus ovis]|uniref:hypothetical protein n=1 Tax=Streptococcus ovis TaxID=82806 RepID=UPI0003791549|nr:hypothetical protein [Streptococcus ovis]